MKYECPYNKAHMVLEKNLTNHLKICHNRPEVEALNLKQEQRETKVERKAESEN